MKRIAHVLVHHSHKVLAATGLITLISLTMFFRASFNADITSFMFESSESGRQFGELNAKYQSGDPITVLASLPPGETYTAENRGSLIKLVELRDALAAVDGVSTVSSLLPTEIPEGVPVYGGKTLDAKLIESLPTFALDKLMSSPAGEIMLSADRRHAMLMVIPAGDADPIELAGPVQAVAVPEGLDVVFAGNPVVFSSILDLMGWFILAIPPIVIVLLLGTFYANIGHKKLTVLSIVPAVLGSIWTFGAIFALGFTVDIVTVIVPIFVMVMGSADGLHFVAHYKSEVVRTDDKVERVAAVLREVGIPMILTTISTAVGFLSLLATDIRPMRQLGVFVALGITFAGIISFFSLPAILSRLELHIRPEDAHGGKVGRALTGVFRKLAMRRSVGFGFAVAVVAFAAIFIPQLKVDSDPLIFFKDDAAVRESFSRIEEALGGAMPLTGEFALDRTQPIEPQLERLRQISTEMEALPGVRRVFSLASLPPDMPGDMRERALAGESMNGMGALASEDGLRFTLFPSDFNSTHLESWREYVGAHDEVQVLTGTPVLFDAMSRLVLDAQIASLATAFVLLALMLFISYRKLRETLVSLVPLALTTAFLLGFLAASNIQLHLLTAVVSSIVIGVGIDYAIHFIAAINYQHQKSDTGYVLRAIDHGGIPILANALGIALGLSALFLSPLRPHMQISMIMWVSMIVAALSALIVIPALYPRRAITDSTP